MTDTTTATADAQPAESSPPVYRRCEVPDHLQHLRTTTELKAQRLKPADGQQPVALLRVYRRGTDGASSPSTARPPRLRCGHCRRSSRLR